MKVLITFCLRIWSAGRSGGGEGKIIITSPLTPNVNLVTAAFSLASSGFRLPETN
jgi:hypothetical protein